MADTVTISFQLLCRLNEKEKGLWSAGCPRLDVYSQGCTREDAKGVLKVAIELFIESCLERNTLDEVLRDSGFRLLSSGVEASESSAQSSLPAPWPPRSVVLVALEGIQGDPQ